MLFMLCILPVLGLAQSTPLTNDDARLDRSQGTVVMIDVVFNDTPTDHWLRSTVRIVDPVDFTTLYSVYDVPEQGRWSITTEGFIEFTPCLNRNDPYPFCTAALDGDPFEIDYLVQDASGSWSNPSIVQITYSDSPLSATIAHFSAVLEHDGLRFDWITAVENGTSGFNLWAVTETGMEQLNSELIESELIDSLEPQSYTYYATLPDADTFYLEEVSIEGTSQTMGPFTLGEDFGQSPTIVEDPDVTEYLFIPLAISGDVQ